MAKYKSLKGQPIQVLTADPPAPIEGQVWVVANPGTASVVKGYALGTGAWASGGNLGTGRYQFHFETFLKVREGPCTRESLDAHVTSQAKRGVSSSPSLSLSGYLPQEAS